MDVTRRLKLAALLLLGNFLFGILGYYTLGGAEWSLLDAVYMTTITLSTIGYGETHDMTHHPVLRIFTITLILTGLGSVTYFFTSLTEFIVEGRLAKALQRRRMSKGITEVHDHFIVCGAGETGLHIIEELQRTRRPFVLIDSDESRVEHLLHETDLLYINDDATADEVLLRAGIERARGLMPCLPSDKDNLFITMSARQLNPNLRIVAKVTDVNVRPKMLRAGADSTVSPQYIGGLRLVSEMIRPAVTGFLDSMMRDPEVVCRIEEVTVDPASPIANKPLGEAAIRTQTGVLVLALKDPDTQGYHHNPKKEALIQPGSVLVVLGDVVQMNDIRRLAGPPHPHHAHPHGKKA